MVRHPKHPRTPHTRPGPSSVHQLQRPLCIHAPCTSVIRSLPLNDGYARILRCPQVQGTPATSSSQKPCYLRQSASHYETSMSTCSTIRVRGSAPPFLLAHFLAPHRVRLGIEPESEFPGGHLRLDNPQRRAISPPVQTSRNPSRRSRDFATRTIWRIDAYQP